MATIATTPKASETILSIPPIASQAPIAKGSRNVAVIGPDATPPESKAIAVNSFGAANVKSNATEYPGIKNHITDIPVITLIMANPRDNATPIESDKDMAFSGMDPAVMFSTCLLRT